VSLSGCRTIPQYLTCLVRCAAPAFSKTLHDFAPMAWPDTGISISLTSWRTHHGVAVWGASGSKTRLPRSSLSSTCAATVVSIAHRAGDVLSRKISGCVQERAESRRPHDEVVGGRAVRHSCRCAPESRGHRQVPSVTKPNVPVVGTDRRVASHRNLLTVGANVLA
jgi:hypothetical protein